MAIERVFTMRKSESDHIGVDVGAMEQLVGTVIVEKHAYERNPLITRGGI